MLLSLDISTTLYFDISLEKVIIDTNGTDSSELVLAHLTINWYTHPAVKYPLPIVFTDPAVPAILESILANGPNRIRCLSKSLIMI